MNDFIFFATLLTLASCEDTIMHIREGEAAKLNFSYLCSSTKVTLRYGYRSPCYSSANPEFWSLLPNQKLEVENGSDVCSLHFTIDPVLRDDAGTYIMTAYKDGEYSEDTRIGLRVKYPPGKATCESSDSYNDEEWVSLRCTALIGTLPGQILCYQSGQRLPPFSNPEQTDRIIAQIILARVEDIVLCCSSSLEQTKSECECDDCGWDPNQKAVTTETTDPCPTEFTPFATQNPTSSNPSREDVQTNSPDSTLPTAIPASTTCNCNNIHLGSSFKSFNVVIVILIFIDIILNACHFSKTWKIEKGLRNLGDLNTSNVLQNLKALVTEREDGM